MSIKSKYPFDDLKRIVKNNPEGSRADHEEAARALFIKDIESYFKPLFGYWFDNHIRQLEVVRYSNGSISVDTARNIEKIATAMKTKPIQSVAKIPARTKEQIDAAKKRTEEFGRMAGQRMQALALLSLTMPNGKELKDCTVAQVRS